MVFLVVSQNSELVQALLLHLHAKITNREIKDMSFCFYPINTLPKNKLLCHKIWRGIGLNGPNLK